MHFIGRRNVTFLLFLLCNVVVVVLYKNIQGHKNASYIAGNQNGLLDNLVNSASHGNTSSFSSTMPPTSIACYPQKNIFFLKTHKCASSTVQNILMRYGFKRNLSFAIPRRNYSNLAGFPDHCHSKYIQSNSRMAFNIFCHHCRFHRDNIRQLLPNETLFISIVRNPTDVFQSSIHYFLNPSESVLNYINSVTRNLTNRSWYSQNPMLFDFGIEMTENRTELQRRVEERVKEFDIILVSDYFEESIILMKERFCWTMEDVVYVVHNQLMNGTRNSFSASEMALIQEWNYGDGLLYSMVNRTFWQRVRKFGHKRMQSEIILLRDLRSQWESRCILNQTIQGNIRDPQLAVLHHNALGYVLKRGENIDTSCLLLVMPEIPFTSKLNYRQTQLFL